MSKRDFVRSTLRACTESQDLIRQSTVMISGAFVACAVHRDQVAKSNARVRKSREQIDRLALK